MRARHTRTRARTRARIYTREARGRACIEVTSIGRSTRAPAAFTWVLEHMLGLLRVIVALPHARHLIVAARGEELVVDVDAVDGAPMLAEGLHLARPPHAPALGRLVGCPTHKHVAEQSEPVDGAAVFPRHGRHRVERVRIPGSDRAGLVAASNVGAVGGHGEDVGLAVRVEHAAHAAVRTVDRRLAGRGGAARADKERLVGREAQQPEAVAHARRHLLHLARAAAPAGRVAGVARAALGTLGDSLGPVPPQTHTKSAHTHMHARRSEQRGRAQMMMMQWGVRRRKAHCVQCV